MTARRRSVQGRTGGERVDEKRHDPGIVKPADDSTPDWLSRHAGWVLIGFGVVLVAASVVVPHRQGVASVFAMLGILVAVFGVLLSLIEGQFEIGLGGVKAQLKDLTEIRKTGSREDLTVGQKGDLMSRQAGVAAGQPDQVAAAVTHLVPKWSVARSDGITPPDWQTEDPPALPPVREFIVTGDVENPVRWAQGFETHVREAFVEDGWEVERPREWVGTGVDFVAEKDGWMVRVEVLLRRRLSASDMRDAIALFDPDARAPRTLGLIVVNSGAPTELALEVARTATYPPVVMEVPVVGW
jgi:hypothetical protein